MVRVAVTVTPVRTAMNFQVEATPSIKVTPPMQLQMSAQTIVVPVAVRLGGPYVLSTAPSTATGTFVHTQSTPAAVWTIPNTPGAKAIILAVYDDAGRVGIADVTVTDTNTVISFSSPRTGRADYIRG